MKPMQNATVISLQQQEQQRHQQKQIWEQQIELVTHFNEQDAPIVHLQQVKNLSKQVSATQQHLQHNTNSLLKRQLRAELKEVNEISTAHNKHGAITIDKLTSTGNGKDNNINNKDFACSALQSLASLAERRTPNTIQPPTANNLQHQFLLHMAANPMLKPSNDVFQEQKQQEKSTYESKQQQRQQHLEQRPMESLNIQREDSLSPTNLDLMLDQNDKSDPELMLTDETAGLDYKCASIESQHGLIATKPSNGGTVCTSSVSNGIINRNNNNLTISSAAAMVANTTSLIDRLGTERRPVQRRRVRRKAQSTLDDQAEHLTEMSVRGLDLFRYARITEGVYQCTECAKENLEKTFKNKYSFQRHAFLYHEGKHRKVFPCTLCGKEFSRPDKMKNHLKMAHENLLVRDTNSLNPLNYLLSAATTEHMQTMIYTDSTSQQQKQQQIHEQPLASNMMKETSLHVEYLNRDGLKMGGNSGTLDKEQSMPASPSSTAGEFKQQRGVVIKNEIVISPSPSPEPLGVSAPLPLSVKLPMPMTILTTVMGESNNTVTAPAAAQQGSQQRLEEVK